MVERVLLAAILAAPLIAPAYAIGPVRLGERRASVERALGPGRVTARPRTDLGRFLVVKYRRAGLTVTFAAGSPSPVTSISTIAPRFHTPRGIGVGSPVRALKHRYPSVSCEGAVCTLGKLLPGHAVTSFYVRHRHVVRVAVGVVID
jgi:hypothetical protein